ncbi:MAG: BatD family protein [candidate division WOR-3 bacterium]
MQKAKLLILSVIWGVLFGAEINFSASVDRTTVGLGEPFQLTVTVEGANIARVPRPQLPELDGFDNLGSSQSQSTSIAIINGRVQQQTAISFVYTLVPKRLGELTIGSCRIVYNNTEYTTEPIKIQVVKSAPGQKPRAQPRTKSPFDMFGEPEPETEGEFLLIATLDRTTVYQGEQITVTWTFYTTRQVASLNLKEPPSLTGFWADDIYQPKQLDYEVKTLKGKRYYAAVIRKTALFPTQSGELKIGAMSLEGEVVTPGFFFSETRPFSVSSDPVKVLVKPLPETNRPQSFTGGVGSFQVSAGLSSNTSSGGEPITLTITITGTGNLGLIGPPSLPEIPGLKVLTPETKDNFSYSSGRLSGTRKFIYPLLPTADGRFRIPEIELGFFDPKAGGYYTKKTPALEFVASNVPTGAQFETAQPGLRLLGTDIRHIKSRMKSSLLGTPLSQNLPVYLYPLGFVIFGLGVVLGRHRQRLQKDIGYARRSRASALARKRLKDAEKSLKEKRQADFYSLVRQALIGYVGDRFNIEAGGMTGEEMREKLGGFGVDGGLIAELLNTINLCEVARFSPGAIECDPKTVLQKAREIINRV